MKRLEKAFDSIKTPDSWKENLYKAAYAETEKPKRKISMKKMFAVTIAATVTCFASAITVGAITGLFDINKVLRLGFSDEISAEKYVRGQYQSLDVSCENDDISFQALAFMGDVDETYTLLAARPKSDRVFDSMAIEVSVLENTITDLENYATFIIDGIADTDSNGEPVYFFNVRNLPCCGLYEIDSESLIVRISKVIYYNSGEETIESTDLSIEFTPDISKLSQVEYMEHKENVSIDGFDCVIEDTHLSDYQASVTFTFDVPNSLDPLVILTERSGLIGDPAISEILNIDLENPYEVNAEECPIKLIVDGETMPFIEYKEDMYHYPYENMSSSENSGNDVTTFYCILNFEPFAFSEAESVEVEITTTNGEVKTLKVK